MQGRDFSAELFGAPAKEQPVGRDFSAELFGAPAKEEKAPEKPVVAAPAPAKKEERPEDQSIFRQVADVPLKLGSGIVQGVRMVADAMGADSSVSKNLRGAEDWIAELYSAQSKKDSKRMAEIMKEAEDQGAVANIIAALNAFKEAPVDLVVQGLGTAAPAVLGSVIAFVAGAPTAATAATALGIGSIMGAGTVKSSIYDATKDVLSSQKELKLTPEQIEKIAVEAQSYGGKNTDMILGGAILGALGSYSGAEPIIARELGKKIIGKTVETEAKAAAGAAAKQSATDAAIKAAERKALETAAERGVIKHGAITGVKEFGTEALQGGQEQLAENIALQREGFDVPTMRGVVGQGVLEGLAGLGVGAPLAGREAFKAKRELAEEEARKETGTTKDAMTMPDISGGKITPATTGEDLGVLMPSVGKDGKPLADVDQETLAAKDEADKKAAEDAAKAKLTLDEATAKAQDYIAKVDGGTAPKQSEIRKLATALGIKIPFGTKNADAVEILRSGIATQGAPSATGTQQQTAGTGAPVDTQSKTPAGGTAGTNVGGVDTSGAAAGAADVGKGTQSSTLKPKTKAQQDEDLLNSLFGGSDLAARRTNAQIEADEKLDAVGKDYGLTREKGESQQAFLQRIRNALAFERQREIRQEEGVPEITAMTDQEIAAQELRGEKTYQPDKEQIEAYEENRQYYNENLDEGEEPLPAYKELSPEDRLVYFQNNIPLGTRGTAAQHRTALQQLADFRSGVKEETGPYQVRDKETGELLFNEDGSPMMVQAPYPGETLGRQTYNDAKDNFSRKTGLSYAFPAWTGLSNESKKLFLDINKTGTALELDMAFRAVKKQIQKELAEKAAGERSAQEQSWVSSQVEQAMAAARAAGQKFQRLPENIIQALFKGDIKTVLDYIYEHGNGRKLKTVKQSVLTDIIKNKLGRKQAVYKQQKINIRDSIAMGVFRLIAGRLGAIENFNVNVVYDPHMIYGDLARYDANTNTVFVGPNGLDEGTILHELVHAATVKIIHQFFTDKSKLPANMRTAVEHLVNIAAAAEKVLGSRKEFANAFENLYEFIAYALTDPDFQLELSKIQVPRLATVTAKSSEQSEALQLERQQPGGEKRYDSFLDNLWGSFTGSLAYMYRLFSPNKKSEKVYLYTEQTGFPKVRTEKEVKEGEELEKAAKGERKGPKKELTASEVEALSPGKLFDKINEKPEGEAKLKSTIEYSHVNGITNLKRAFLQEPGYKGNLLLEAAEMFELILAAPEGGIEQLAGKGTLGSDLLAKKQKTEEKKTREGGLYDEKLRMNYALSKLEQIKKTAKDFKNRIFTTKGWLATVREFVDRTYMVRYRQKQLEMAGLIERDPTKAYNNVADLGDTATGKARNYLMQFLHKPMMELEQAIGDLARLTKKSVNDDILPTLHMLGEAMGEPEKRHMKWLLSVPLSTVKNLTHNGKKISAAQRRIDLMGDPRTGKPGIVHKIELTPAQQKQVRAELEALAKAHADPLGDSPRIKNEKVRERALNKRQKQNQLGVMDINEDSDVYNVLGINKAEVDLRMQQFNEMSDEEKALINKIMDSIREVTKQTAELNKIGNYWSYPVSNIVGIYDYKNYMPFKGLSKHSVVDELIDPDGGRTKTSRLLQQEEHAAHGRFSVSDNPILQTMSDAFRAAGRAGRRDFMQSILNAVKPNKHNPTGTGVIDGEVVDRIAFSDRDTTDMSKYQGKSYIFVYNPDGSISIVKINEKEVLEALRYQYKENGFFVDLSNQLTSGVGSMHTRWNMNFAPKNFVSDTLQNAWTIGAGKSGPLSSLKYLADVASTTVVRNGLGKAMEVAILYEKSDAASKNMLRNMVKKDPFVKDMVEMLQFGGKTAYLQSFSLKSSLEQLEKSVGRNGIIKTVEGAGALADVWGSMFEFTSRTAAYQLFKEQYLKEEIAKGVSNEKNGKEMSPAEYAAAQRAAADTKNLTNFEVVGTNSRYMTGLFMFFKASAVSAVRTMEAAAPAFRPMSWAESQLPASIRNNEVALNKWRQEYKQLKQNAQIMVGSLIGMGYCIYLMSMLSAPDDEWGRNNTKYDNMDQWTRYARFHLPEGVANLLGMRKDTVFQIPWGFGLGSFASVGAQVGGMIHGQASLKQGLSNIVMGSLADAFMPLPVSKIPFTEKPFHAIADTITPSLVRPYFEYLFNVDGVGRGINSTMNRRLGDAYTGSDRVPLAYKDAADYLFKVTDGAVSWSPNTMYFFANSYIDGIARFGEITYALAGVSKEEKQFNPKTDLPLFGSFFGAKTNVDAREYGNMESRIKEMDKRIYTLDQQYPEQAARYDAEHPFDRVIVEIYKKRQGELNKLRKEATDIRTDRYLSPKNKEEMIKILTLEQNVIKHELVEDFKAYGMKP